jgi:hypothetical protein
MTILIGAIFLVVGIVLVMARFWGGALFMIPGILLIYLETRGPLAGKENKLQELLQLKASQIRQVRIMPTREVRKMGPSDLSLGKQSNFYRADAE